MTGIGINSNDTIVIQRTKKIDDNAVVLLRTSTSLSV